MAPVPDALQEVLGFVGARRLDYMLMGGLAVRILALPRTTFDVDLMVAVSEDDVAAFARAADEAGFLVDGPFLHGFVDRLAGLGKIHFDVPEGARSVRVDVFVLASEYQRAAFQRRRLHKTDLGEVYVMSPEDLLLHKLIADRPRDRADVGDLLLVTGDLDLSYLRSWAKRLGVGDRLERALKASGRAT